MTRAFVAAASLLMLAACAGTDELSTLQPPGFLREAPEIAATADWNQPETLTVELVDYDFRPDHLLLHRDRPTRLVLVNRSAKDHTFVSRAFFSGVAVKAVAGPDGTVEAPWVEKLVVPAGQTKEMLFVPARYGAFPFECTVTGHAAFGMTGVVNVE